MKKIEKTTDEKLVRLSIEKPDNFGLLMSRYWDSLFRYIKRISYFEKEDIEDIIQEAFIKIYKNLNSFDQSLKFSTWIYQITRNVMIDAIRKKSARPQTAGLEEKDLERIFRTEENLEKKINNRQELERIKKVINDLPIKYKEALVLRFLEEKSYEEMMDILKKPRGTVASLVNRGRKMILEELESKNQGIKNYEL